MTPEDKTETLDGLANNPRQADRIFTNRTTTPFAFRFHNTDVGHTAFVGPLDKGLTCAENYALHAAANDGQ